MKDGLKDIKSVQLEEEESDDDNDLDKNLRNDSIEANYLRMDNPFQDSIIYTVEPPVS